LQQQLLASASACESQLDLEPFDSKSENAALSTPSDLQTATYGSYAGLVNANFTRPYHFLAEYPGDNVALSGTTSDALLHYITYIIILIFQVIIIPRTFGGRRTKLFFLPTKSLRG
jgi:hypothetical protein